MSAESSPATPFDPDSGAGQPEGSLEALIRRIEAEIRELQFPRFTKDRCVPGSSTVSRIRTGTL